MIPTNEERDILIIVKTYPEISRKHTETVCTGGILSDTGELVRLYPIRYRYLDGENQFKKYQWIRAKINKTPNDNRPESYNIDYASMSLGDYIEPGKDWHERRKWVLNEYNVYKSLEALHITQEDKGTSLGLIKPKKIEGFFAKRKTDEDIKEAIAKKDSIVNQLDMFEQKKDLEILPYYLMLKFYCDDKRCAGHELSILDWEFGELYRKVKNRPGWEKIIDQKIRGICNPKRDTYFILGNMHRWQHVFCILGFFYPPKQRQMRLF